jgi:hypothetical protein
MNLFRLTFCILCVVVVTACSHTVPVSTSYKDQPKLGFMYSSFVNLYYAGDVQSFESVGVVSLDATVSIESIKDSKGNAVKPVQLFGKRGFYPTGMNQHHLLPGEYTFELSYDFYQGGLSARSTSNVVIQVTVFKGSAIHLQAVLDGRRWSVVQRDSSQDMSEIKADFDSAIKTRIK